MDKHLYIFTAEYPFLRKENFLEDEIVYLAKEFKQITIIPLSGSGCPRAIPVNCVVDNDLCKGRLKKIIFGIFGILRVLPQYLNEYFSLGIYRSPSKTKSLLFNMIICSYYMQSNVIRKLMREIKKDDVVYFYWGVVYNTVAPYLKGKAKLISRFHGDWDLWTPSGKEGYKPGRKALITSLDKAIFISKKGRDFFQSIYPNVSTEVFHLGSRDIGIAKKSQDGIIRIVSCSTVYPLKRVPLIFESVKTLKDITVEWTHIGGGPDFEQLCNLVKKCPDNIKINLMGAVSLDQVFDYYKHNPVDVFINLSTNEGVPVSIMEAISQDIPVVATNVGGNSEIVTSETGTLVSADPTPEEVGFAIKKVINNKKLTPRQFWKKEFCAEENYTLFAKYLANKL